MKKFIVFICFLFLSFVEIGLNPAFAVVSNTYNEGIYTLSNFSPAKNNIYSVSNVSSGNYMGIIITDEEQNILQSIRLKPDSEKHNTIPIAPDYKIIILGKGSVYIDPVELKE